VSKIVVYMRHRPVHERASAPVCAPAIHSEELVPPPQGATPADHVAKLTRA
jgi:hypothetical protein